MAWESATRWSTGSGPAWWQGAVVGAIVFVARHRTTKYGMLQPNTNAFLRLLWSLSTDMS